MHRNTVPIHRRVRGYVFFVAAASVVATLLLISHAFSETLAPPAAHYKEVVVQDGDTLWQIARRHGHPQADTRRTVDRIRRANDLTSAVVQPGQVLKVPVD